MNLFTPYLFRPKHTWQKYNKPITSLIYLCLFTFLTTSGIMLYRYVAFDIDVEARLKRAADSNQPELAIQEIEAATAALDEWKVSCPEGEECYTSVIYNTPDEEVGFWRTNLEQTLDDLRALPPEASHLEVSNTLMKVRETILDQGKSSPSVTVPPGVSRYPYNTSLSLALLFSMIGLGILPIANIVFYERKTNRIKREMNELFEARK